MQSGSGNTNAHGEAIAAQRALLDDAEEAWSRGDADRYGAYFADVAHFDVVTVHADGGATYRGDDAAHAHARRVARALRAHLAGRLMVNVPPLPVASVRKLAAC